LVAHLDSDPNAQAYGRLLATGTLAARVGQISTRDELGSISTLFVELGSDSGKRHALTLTGNPRFLVRDALRFWRDSSGDEEKLALLERYIAAARDGELTNQTLTLAPDVVSGQILVDGNKRAIALYEAGAATQYPLRVFVLDVTRPLLRSAAV